MNDMTPIARDISQYGVEVLPYRAHFFVNFRNTAIQRWAARLTKGDQYYTLSGSFWRNATDERTMPPEVVKVPGGGNTMYFRNREIAHRIAERFVAGLIEKGVV